jgi:23S rRNA (cytosine1962-C5)-methyltransferase
VSGLILFEDDDLLVVHKPSGLNTHKPDRYEPDGIYEWLTKHGRKLSIHQRLDKETSGVLVFGKSVRAAQSLARQFESHKVRKDYLLLCAARPTRQRFRAETAGEATEFEYVQPHGDAHLIAARPITGKTHQIRRHAAANGFPILGDAQYGGAPAPRLMLHAHRISLEEGTFEASIPAAFDEMDPVVVARENRELFFDDNTNAYRLLCEEDVIVDWYDGHALVQWQTEKTRPLELNAKTVHEQLVTKQRRTAPVGPALGRFPIRENGLTYLVNFGEGLSPGIFLDQRENRYRLLGAKGKRVLNCFAYTCAFSVAAAKAGAATTSVDLSRNYLEWGKENFRANGLDLTGHDFIFGDVFEWLKRFAKRGQTWDIVLLDPPTFSTTKKGRSFRAERDYLELAKLAATLVVPGGTLFCSTNQRTIAPAAFERTIRQCGRAIVSMEFEALPFDFCRPDPSASRRLGLPAGYLKTTWATLE